MKLYSENPHYIEYHGKPVLLVGSGEHYGSVLNLDFDYTTYLDVLGRLGLNQVRIFSGTYRERPGHIGIGDNTLAPAAGRFICPWVETAAGKFDLTHFNPDYFARLKDFLDHARRHGVFVSLSLFCYWYGPDFWDHSPMHPANNLQGIGPLDKEQVFTLLDNPLLPVQEAFVRRMTAEVAEFDNLYFEICNEPYSRHDHTAYEDWQHHLVDAIRAADQGAVEPHLIGINYHNRTKVLVQPHAGVSICNFHYALPEAVKANYHFNLPIADDETGFQGQLAAPYRQEAWNFLLAGGGIFGHLDYSFTTSHPDGTSPMVGSTPGYGGSDLREQLSFLRQFLEDNQVWKMKPYNEGLGQIFVRAQGQIMADPGRTYLMYFPENVPGMTHMLWLPKGKYTLDWVNPVGCRIFKSETLEYRNSSPFVRAPEVTGDLALKCTRLG